MQPVCRQIDMPDPVFRHEQIDDVLQIAAERRLSPAEPEVRERGHVFRKPDDFLPVQVTRPVQLFPVKTRVTRGIAVGGHEKDERVQLAAPPRWTTVRTGDSSLYRICRHVMFRVSADRIRLYSRESAVTGANRI